MQTLLDDGRGNALEQRVLQLFAVVIGDIERATTGLLRGAESAGETAAWRLLDEVYAEAEALVHGRLDADAFMCGDELSELLRVLRILPEFARGRDLAQHLALCAGLPGHPLDVRSRVVVQAMSQRVASLWRAAAALYEGRGLSGRDRARTGELETLRGKLAPEFQLVGRLYVELGERAARLAGRVGAKAQLALV
jgi:hypothetical protein